MAVDPEPVIQTLSLDEMSQHACINTSQHKSFSFSTFASSSIFAKPRQKKVKKKSVNMQKYNYKFKVRIVTTNNLYISKEYQTLLLVNAKGT